MEQLPSINQAPTPTQPPAQIDMKNMKYLFFAGIGLVILIFCILVIILTFDSQGNITGAPTPTPIGGSVLNKDISTNPKDKENQADYTGDITMTFSYRISIADARFSLNPSTKGTFRQLTANTLSFKPNEYLNSTTKYTATVDWKNSNNEEKRYTWSFTTDSSSGEEGFTQSEVEAFQKTRLEADRATRERREKFPFLTLLPYTTSFYKIEITANDTIVITTYGTTTELTQKYKNEAIKWLTDHGGNPSSLSIQYLEE